MAQRSWRRLPFLGLAAVIITLGAVLVLAASAGLAHVAVPLLLALAVLAYAFRRLARHLKDMERGEKAGGRNP